MSRIGILVSEYSTTYGVKVIVEHLRQVMQDLHVVHNINETDKYDIVIPYGIIQAKAIVKYGRKEKTCALMVDALSLGMISDFRRMSLYVFIPFKFKIKLLARYFAYLYREYVCLKNYEHVMLVSAYDKSYFARHPLFKRYADKIVVIPNGIDINDIMPSKRLTPSDGVVRIGCLSAWNDSAFYTLRIFLEDIWSKAQKKDDNMRLVVAGTKLTPQKEAILKQYDNVEVMGFVESLDDFFDNIDISLITFLKKCGILNKVLDSFAYEVPVLGRPQNFGAFENIPDCYYTYNDKDSFFSAIKQITSNPTEVQTKVKMAKDYIRENHSWEKNYKTLGRVINKL